MEFRVGGVLREGAGEEVGNGVREGLHVVIAGRNYGKWTHDQRCPVERG